MTLPPTQSVVLFRRRPVGPIHHGRNFFIDATAPVAIPSPAASFGGGSIGGTNRQGLQLRMESDGACAAACCAGILLLPPFFVPVPREYQHDGGGVGGGGGVRVACSADVLLLPPFLVTVPRGFEHDGGGRHFDARCQQVLLVNDGGRGHGQGWGAEGAGVLLAVSRNTFGVCSGLWEPGGEEMSMECCCEAGLPALWGAGEWTGVSHHPRAWLVVYEGLADGPCPRVVARPKELLSSEAGDQQWR